MSRIRYAEEEDFQGQAALWEANMERSLNGLKGQIALLRLRDALLALPEKKLVANVIKDAEGHVCALGALAIHENYQGDLSLPIIHDEEYGDWQDEAGVEEAMLSLAADLQIPRLVAMAIIDKNDDSYLVGFSNVAITPELRYRRVLSWVERRIRKDLIVVS